MGDCVKEEIIPAHRGSEKIHSSSLILSTVAILLTIVLFVRIEAAIRATRMMEAKFDQEIKEVKDVLRESVELQVVLNEELDVTSSRWRVFGEINSNK